MVLLFRWLSSVRLAVPLLLILAGVVAVGTLLESFYSAAFAKLVIYQTIWFYALMALLGLNILCAALSRWPWQRRHAGFVVTHFGMLLMLAGAYVTAQFGIDGELQLEEGATGVQVGLPALELRLEKGDHLVAQVDVPRWSTRKSAKALEALTRRLEGQAKLALYEPFTLPEEELVKAEGDPLAAPAISFWLRSQFFNTSEWLHARDRAQIQLGPATLRLVVDKNEAPRLPQGQGAILRVLKGGLEVSKISLAKLKSQSVKVGPLEISLLQTYESASVVGNKLIEKEGGPLNPAIEFHIRSAQGGWREISFANFKDFSLRKDENFPYRFEYSPADQRGVANLIEFHMQDEKPVRIELYKHGQLILKEDVVEGSTVATPWMGMKIIVARILTRGGVLRSVIKPLESPGKGALAPSALKVDVRPDLNFWLMEGDSKEWWTDQGLMRITYAQKQLKLPFTLRLDKFIKREYPGTSKALSFESHVVVPETNEASVISMNEPLVKAGFTLYQASFQAESGRRPVSILSVNRDPGRTLKYLGGLVTSLGILLYMLMRSRMWLGKKGS